MLLYQYRRRLDEEALGYLEDLLSKGSMKFTRPADFNDPFDCCPTVFADAPTVDFPHAAGDSMNRGLQEATSVAHGVACFTPHVDSMLMWSHYGDQHRGICVGFDSDELVAHAPKNDSGHPLYHTPVAVTYTKIRPGDDSPEAFTMKSEDWSYEDEYRLISAMKKGSPVWGPGVWDIPKSAFVELVFGARIPEAVQARVVELAKKYTPRALLKKVVLHTQTYDLLIEDLAFQPEISQMKGQVLDPNGNWLRTHDDQTGKE